MTFIFSTRKFTKACRPDLKLISVVPIVSSVMEPLDYTDRYLAIGSESKSKKKNSYTMV